METFDTDLPKSLMSAIDGASILLLEDVELFAQTVMRLLRKYGAKVDWYENGPSAFAAGSVKRYDLLLFDREVPGMDGPKVLEELRQCGRGSHDSPALIMTSGSNTLAIRLQSFGAGADDFVSKAGNEEQAVEFLARVAAKTRRNLQNMRTGGQGGKLVNGPLVADEKTREVTLHGLHVKNKWPNNFDVLCVFMRNSGSIMTNSMIFRSLKPAYSILPDGYEGAVNTAVRRVREDFEPFKSKLPEHCWPIILNKKSQGYVLPDLSDIPTHDSPG